MIKYSRCTRIRADLVIGRWVEFFIKTLLGGSDGVRHHLGQWYSPIPWSSGGSGDGRNTFFCDSSKMMFCIYSMVQYRLP